MAIRDRRVTAISWLTMLKHVTRQTSEPVTKDKLAAYAALLADEFGPEVFTQESLKAVADASEFFPPHKIVRDFLLVYQARHRSIHIPDRPMLPAWLAEKIVEGSGGNPGPMTTAYLASKGIHPPWPGYVTPEDAKARADQLAADWDDEAAIRAKADQVRQMPRDTTWQQVIHQQVLDTILMIVKLHAPRHFDAAIAQLRQRPDVQTASEPVTPILLPPPGEAFDELFGG